MALKHIGNEPRHTNRNNRDRIRPFIQDESAIKALQEWIGEGTAVPRECMYTLEIINNIIQSNNGQQNLYQRIPPEVFGGMPEGGRRNVQASLITRAVTGTNAQEQGRVLASGYTRIQEIIGHWAENDGCWKNTPDADLIKQGYKHNPNDDGSEAHVFDKDGKFVKTIDFGHFNAFELMMDRISIHNATFPETPMIVEGFGIRDDAINNSDFVVIISQPAVYGRKPTQAEIEDSMSKRGYDKSENGFFFISRLDNTIISDVHDQNAVLCKHNGEDKVLVFDCEAFLKFFPVDTIRPEKIPIHEFLPGKDGKLTGSAWERLLGDEYAKVSEQEKSQIINQLRLHGRYNGRINGKIVALDSPREVVMTNRNGEQIHYYEGDVSFGYPDSYKKERLYSIPSIQFNPDNVRDIKLEVARLMPISMSINEFLFNPKYVGQLTAALRGGGDKRKQYKQELQLNGRIDGLVNGQFIVQRDPSDKNKVLVNSKENIEFMLWTNNAQTAEYGRLTPNQKALLANGKTVSADNKTLHFNIDKGRVDTVELKQIKKQLKHNHTRSVSV